FTADISEKDTPESANTASTEPAESATHRRSVVQVYFPSRNMNLSYYNDRFDLKPGDMVYVDGKLEGMRGRITEVNYNFKIKISDYKRVVAVVDTTVKGQFFMAGSHFLTFDPSALPMAKTASWFMAPREEDEEFVRGNDDTTFQLSDLSGMQINSAVADRGYEYYAGNKVRYLCIDGTQGYAIVEGSKAYEVEFQYTKGDVSGLVCSCFCSCSCKHEVSAMLQLRETLEFIEKHYETQYKETGYFAAVDKGTLFAFSIEGKKTGTFTL
ncbi:MAG: hypothetical protein Q4C00_02660, partial [Bacillota bacterium]|nr:hypothetical protein [Bacillota bacterium]